MNIYLFWTLFLGLWGIVPLMIIKGKNNDKPKLNNINEAKTNKKTWFSKN